jgi:hypothetical protein
VSSATEDPLVVAAALLAYARFLDALVNQA